MQSRKGYYAIKGTFASPVLAYEAAALAALDNAPMANSFPFYAGGFSFPERKRMGLAPVMVDVPLSAFTIHVDQEKMVYDTDFSIVALLKIRRGVVENLSINTPYGPLDKVRRQSWAGLFYLSESSPAATLCEPRRVLCPPGCARCAL